MVGGDSPSPTDERTIRHPAPARSKVQNGPAEIELTGTKADTDGVEQQKLGFSYEASRQLFICKLMREACQPRANRSHQPFPSFNGPQLPKAAQEPFRTAQHGRKPDLSVQTMLDDADRSVF